MRRTILVDPSMRIVIDACTTDTHRNPVVSVRTSSSGLTASTPDVISIKRTSSSDARTSSRAGRSVVIMTRVIGRASWVLVPIWIRGISGIIAMDTAAVVNRAITYPQGCIASYVTRAMLVVWLHLVTRTCSWGIVRIRWDGHLVSGGGSGVSIVVVKHVCNGHARGISTICFVVGKVAVVEVRGTRKPASSVGGSIWVDVWTGIPVLRICRIGIFVFV